MRNCMFVIRASSIRLFVEIRNAIERHTDTVLGFSTEALVGALALGRGKHMEQCGDMPEDVGKLTERFPHPRKTI